uniref:uncharacterized protein ccdc14 isoform X2 n=1 Tax=Doryrhamphus excisus TaxID=161450 RepID=UPI0025AD9FE3|nr:uncharacterized protein ccdc14 isoform X2 [Doryrhamphus excisus]
MKRIAKRKVLTPGRLTGGAAREQQARKRATTTPGRAEPAYSLYSSDPRDQVDSLHYGLDRCAALLSGILHVHKAEPSTQPVKAATAGAGKPKPSAPLRRKTSRKPPANTEQSRNMSPGPQCLPPGVQQNHAPIHPLLPPSLKVIQPLPGSASSRPDPVPHTDRQPPGGHHATASFNGEEVDAVPVRDGDTQMLRMQEEMTLAQSRLQEIQVDLAEVKKCLLDTRKQLKDTEEEKELMKSELESIRRKLVHSDQAKNRLALLAQQRLEQIENLKRIIQNGSDTVVGIPVSDTATREKHNGNSTTRDIVTKYLTTLRQSEASDGGGHVHFAPKSEGNAPAPGKVTSHPQRLHEAHRLTDEALHVTSVSTFDTRDEVAFQDGLAALDASIASLKKTIQLDLSR